MADANLQIAISAKDLTGPGFAGVKRNMDQMAASLNAVNRGVAGMQNMFAQARVAAIGFLSHMALSGLLDFHKHIIEVVGGLDELAQQLGTTAQSLQAYQFAAVQGGVKQEQLEAGFIKFNRTIGEAVNGDKKAIDALNQLGVKILDVNGKLRPMDDLLAEVARKINDLGSEAEKTAALNDFFGKTGARLIPILGDMAGGVDDLKRRAREAGVVIDDDVIKKLDKAGDQSAILKKRFEATFAKSVSAPMVDTLEAISGWMNTLINQSGDLELAMHRAFQGMPFIGGLATTFADARAKQVAEEEKRRQAGASRQGGYGPFFTTTPAGTSNPVEKGQADKAAKKLDELRDEGQRFADRLGMLKADKTTPWADLDKQLDSIEKTQKRIDDIEREFGKGRGSAQIVFQANATEKARLAMEKYQDAVIDADKFQRQFGDGTLAANQTLEKLNAAFSTGRLTVDAYKVATQETQREQEKQRLTMIGLADQGWGGFAAGIQMARTEWERANNSFAQGQKFFENTISAMETALTTFVQTGKFAFRDFALSVIADLGKMALKAASTNIFTMITGLLGIGGGSTAGGSGSFLGTFGGGLLGGARASGGPVAGGRTYLVGEEGPELFTAPRSGTIWPTGSAPAGDGGNIIIHQSYVVSGGDEGAVDRAMVRWLPVMKKQALDAVLDARQRGGKFASAFR